MAGATKTASEQPTMDGRAMSEWETTTATVSFDLASGPSWSTAACQCRKCGKWWEMPVGGHAPKEAIQHVEQCRGVTAQHEETGRMWNGSLQDLPPRYFVVNADSANDAQA